MSKIIYVPGDTMHVQCGIVEYGINKLVDIHASQPTVRYNFIKVIGSETTRDLIIKLLNEELKED